MYYKTKLGKKGEELAKQYLIKKDYIIIEQNFRTRLGEIDIIAKARNELVFVEVKTRTTNKYGAPSEAVDDNKIKHITRVAEYYIYIKKLEKSFIRFDVIEVEINNGQHKINHLKQII